MPLVLHAEGALPFTAAELRAAVELRLPLAVASASEVESLVLGVRSAGKSQVEISFRHKRRMLDLEGRRGSQAARWVALALSDLVRGEVDLLGPPRPRAATRPAAKRAASRPATRAVAASVRRRPRPSPPRARTEPTESVGAPPLFRFALIGAVGGGTNADRPTGLVLADTSIRLVGPLRAIAAAGAALTSPGSVEGQSVSLTGLPVRLGLGWTFWRSRLEARLGLCLEPYWVGGSSSELSFSHAGFLIGAGSSAFYLLRVSRRLDLMLGAGVDVSFNRAEFLLRGSPALATERLLVWAAAGIGARTLR